MRTTTSLACRHALAAVVLLAACGSSGGGTVGDLPRNATATGPTPAEMCPSTSEAPSVAAYDLRTGAYRWSVCSSADAWYSIEEVRDDVVVVGRNDGSSAWPAIEAYALADGRPRQMESPPTTWGTPGDGGPVTIVEVDGVRVVGGQDDETAGYDARTGRLLWSHPEHLAYDDVAAVDDRAVYVAGYTATSATLYAYDLRSGATRWTRPLADLSSTAPWSADRGLVFVLGSNLLVLAADDGALVWRTPFAEGGFPHMTDVATDGDTVVVVFSTVASGGD